MQTLRLLGLLLFDSPLLQMLGAEEAKGMQTLGLQVAPKVGPVLGNLGPNVGVIYILEAVGIIMTNIKMKYI